MKPYVFGAKGQLGQCLQMIKPDWNYFSSEDVDFSDPRNIELFFSHQTQPPVIVNLSAYTAVDKAESEEDLARRINGLSVGELAKHCQHFIHISTDYVFDGQGTVPLPEHHPTNPINAYGRTKLLGEELAQKYSSRCFVIRTSWVFSEFGNNFVKTMLRLSATKSELSVVDDQIGSPTYAMDLAEVIGALASEPEKHSAGLYHFSNSGECSWFDFAQEIFRLRQSPTVVRPIPTAQYPTPAKRPIWSVLDSSKIRNELNIDIPSWQDALKRCLQKL